MIYEIGGIFPNEYDENLLIRNRIEAELENWDIEEPFPFRLDTIVISTGFAQLVDEGTIEIHNKRAIKRQMIWADMYSDIEYNSKLEILERALEKA